MQLDRFDDVVKLETAKDADDWAVVHGAVGMATVTGQRFQVNRSFSPRPLVTGI